MTWFCLCLVLSTNTSDQLEKTLEDTWDQSAHCGVVKNETEYLSSS